MHRSSISDKAFTLQFVGLLLLLFLIRFSLNHHSVSYLMLTVVLMIVGGLFGFALLAAKCVYPHNE